LPRVDEDLDAKVVGPPEDGRRQALEERPLRSRAWPPL